jgi:hypothetical protein
MAADTAAGVTYQWQQGGVDIAGATNSVFVATTSGSYRVFEINSAGCTIASGVATVTVFALPGAGISASGPTTFCIGGSVTLSTTAAAGNSYQWYNGGVAIAGATNSTYVANTSSSITVKVTFAAGCVNITASPVVITEVTVPVVIPFTPTSFCWGGSALLGVSVSTSAGVTYQWQLGGANIIGATGATYSANVSGNYTCVISVASGACVIGTTAVTLTELPLPNPVIIWDGSNLKVGNTFSTYQWFKSMVPISGATSWYITPTDTGRYTVQVTDTTGCHSFAPEYPLHSLGNVVVATTANNSGVSIFPNPAENVVHITAAGKVRAVLSTIDGRKLLDEADATDIDISSLPNGTYLLLLYDKDGTMVKAERLAKN